MQLKAESLTDQAYQILKQKILSRELAPGTRIVDSQLARQFGISRTPIRDAIRCLVEDGLVTNYGNRGYQVFKPTKKDIEEIFEIRLLLDEAAVRKIVRDVLPHNREVREKIMSMLIQMRKQSAADNDSIFAQSDEDFHDQLILLVENERMYLIYKDIRNQTRLFRQRTAEDRARIAKAYLYHERICEGLLELNLEKTLAAVYEHIELSKKDALMDFDSES